MFQNENTHPINKVMMHESPVINEIGLFLGAKREYDNLEDTQYRLSGLIKPIEYFLNSILQGPALLTRATAVEFA
ncbi:hypothetical protein BB560_003260 [Smittium megazygosporum]|uniref:Uncharacterized protein n=1 Tax=Smittium megazygosporum TaxID=133381 RepID=A0A2T9ZCH8_9FUNG|nr:hypothetical protein BB560_003260 [Smittium megazygosporum]